MAEQQKGIVRRTIDRLKSLFSLTKSASGERTFAKRSEKEWNDYLRKLMDDPKKGPSGIVMGDMKKTRVSRPKLGMLVTFRYDAKHKATLDYWSRYPVSIMAATRENGFLGLNLQYFPPAVRIKLLTAILTNEKEGARMLAEFFRTPNFEVAWKHYLFSHIKSPIYVVPLDLLPIAACLPVRFIKGETDDAVEAKTVYADYFRK